AQLYGDDAPRDASFAGTARNRHRAVGEPELVLRIRNRARVDRGQPANKLAPGFLIAHDLPLEIEYETRRLAAGAADEHRLVLFALAIRQDGVPVVGDTRQHPGFAGPADAFLA